MNKMNRREFLKLATATTAGAAMICTADGSYIFPDAVAKADPAAPEVVYYNHCQGCNSGPKCGMKLILKDGQLIRIERRSEGGHNNPNICAKGAAQVQDIHNPNRLLHPMKRTNPKGEPAQWEQISWEEAIETIAAKFTEIKEKYGAEKVLFSTGDPKEPRPVLQRLCFLFGSPNYGTESSTCSTGTRVASYLNYGKNSFATGAGPTPGKTKLFINWGTNPAWSSSYYFETIQKAKASGCKIIVVDPRVTPTVSCVADLHLQIRPATDAALALCFGNAIIQADKYDHDFVENYSHGFEEYKARCAEYTVEKTAEICQISVETLQKAIDMILGVEGPMTIQFRAAYPHHVNGVGMARSIQTLIPLTGNLDVDGGQRVSNAKSISLENTKYTGNKLATKGQYDDPTFALRADREYFPVWAECIDEIQLNMLPEYVKDGKIRAAFMLGQNAMMWPDTAAFQKAFDEMDFAVACDYYINPWTHDHCDIILPSAMCPERNYPITTNGMKIFGRQAIPAQGEAHSDCRIVADLACALGFSEEFCGGGEGVEDKIIENILFAGNKDIVAAGVKLADVYAAAPNPVVVPTEQPAENPEKKYRTQENFFATPTGKFEFASEVLKKFGFDPVVDHIEPAYSPISTPDVAKDFPLILNTGSRVPMYVHSRHRQQPWLRALMPDPIVRLYPTDAAERGIVEGDDVILATPFGEIKVKAEVTNIVKPGVIDIFHGWQQANVNGIMNRVIGETLDPLSGFPAFKEGLCQVRKA